MINNQAILTKVTQEEKGRKIWLAVLIGQFLLNILLTSFMLFNFDNFKETPSFPKNISLFFAVNLMVVFFTISLIFNYALYHCAYKNHGTKLLTFTLVIMVLNIIFDIFNWFSNSTPSNAFISLRTTINCVLDVWWFILSIDLRRINKAIQLSGIYDKEYLEFVASIRNSKNLEELELKFYEIIRNHPDALSTIVEEYKVAKKALACNVVINNES